MIYSVDSSILICYNTLYFKCFDEERYMDFIVRELRKVKGSIKEISSYGF